LQDTHSGSAPTNAVVPSPTRPNTQSQLAAPAPAPAPPHVREYYVKLKGAACSAAA